MRTEYEFNVGDRVRVVREFYNDQPVPVGSIGTVEADWVNENGPYISRTSHATANGGGHDIHVRLENGRRIMVRAEGHLAYIEKVER